MRASRAALRNDELVARDKPAGSAVPKYFNQLRSWSTGQTLTIISTGSTVLIAVEGHSI